MKQEGPVIALGLSFLLEWAVIPWPEPGEDRRGTEEATRAPRRAGTGTDARRAGSDSRGAVRPNSGRA